MSRHRSPAGRNAHHGPAPERVAAPGARPRRTHDGPPWSGRAAVRAPSASAVALLERDHGAERPAWFDRPPPAPLDAVGPARPGPARHAAPAFGGTRLEASRSGLAHSGLALSGEPRVAGPRVDDEHTEALPAAPAAPAGTTATGPAPVAPVVLSPDEWESQHALHVPPADWNGPRIRARERARHAATPAVRNGLAGAAATGTALAVVVPLLGALPDAPAAGTEALTLAAAGVAAPAGTEDAAAEGPGTVLLASVSPVLAVQEDLPPGLDAAGLLKSVGLAEEARAAEEARLAREAQANCDAGLRGLGAVKSFVRDAARFISCLYDEPTLIGVAGRARVSDHPRGLAVDFMTRGEQGDRIADCALANREALGISYVIWKQRVNYGDGWERMADRGSDTENHFDHVHVSFEGSGGDGGPVAALCG